MSPQIRIQSRAAQRAVRPRPLLLYAITAAQAQPNDPEAAPVRGVQDAPVSWIQEGAVAALVSELPSPHLLDTPSCADILTFDGVLEHFASVLTLLPVRYGTSASSETALRRLLRARGARLTGILNGIDPSEWDPAVDPHLLARYSAADLTGKAQCRRALCEAAGFAADDPGMILGAIGRLTEQKGFDVLLDAVPRLLAEGTRIVMLGSGDPALERRMLDYAAAHPGRFRAWLGYDEARAHGIEAGADSFIMPSRFEPCGLNQMYSLAYGTPPIVRRTGGLADTVIGYQGSNLDVANGFVFDDLTPEAIVGTVAWARSTLAGPQWPQLVFNAMRADFSWRRSAELYGQVYRQARSHRGLPF